MNNETQQHLFAQCKAYYSFENTLKICEKFIQDYSNPSTEIYLSVPYSFIQPISQKFNSPQIHIGGDCMLSADHGDFTETVCGKMLQDAHAKFVLIGTSDERVRLKTNPLSLKNKLTHALNSEISPFICLTDTEIDFQDGNSKNLLADQLQTLISDISIERLKTLHILYEAAWITESPWTSAENTLYKALTNFLDAVSEITPHHESLHLVAPVPAFSPELPEIFKKLQDTPYNFHGFSLGVLTL